MLKSVTGKGVDFIRRQHRAFKVNIARNLISKFSIGLTQQYQSIYVSALGASAVELGLVSSVGGIANTLFMLPVGWLADRYGIRKTLMTGLGIMLLSFLTFGLAQGWQMGGVAMGLFTTGFSCARARRDGATWRIQSLTLSLNFELITARVFKTAIGVTIWPYFSL